MLAELSARHDVLRQYARTTADAVLRGEDATRFATIGKLLGSRLQREVADYAVQFHGGIGLHGRDTGPRATSATPVSTPSARAPTR